MLELDAKNLAPSSGDRKLFAGPRIRRMRGELGLTQTRMAESLGVSVSYLNLIERNQRPVTAQFLLRLAEVHAVDLRSLTSDAGEQMLGDVATAMTDPLFRGLDVPRSDLQDLVQQTPAMAQAFLRLYGAWRERLEQGAGSTEPANTGPIELVRDWVQDRGNHFPALDEAAEHLAEELRLTEEDRLAALRLRFRERHGITLRILPVEVMPELLRRYDHHRKQLQLSELLSIPARAFQALIHLAGIEARALIDAEVKASGFEDEAGKGLLRINLANYFAAAVMMPYARFHMAAEQCGYDLLLIQQRFGVSFEQLCHRLTTLQRPSMRGVPFFLIRVDRAGNISKRFAAGRFPFSRFGGSCPLWHVHAAFEHPGEILHQIIELPDGARFFSLARAINGVAQGWGSTRARYSIGLGCDISHARHLVYAGGTDLARADATPIGINCPLCPRESCTQRSAPPLGTALLLDERTRGMTSLPFAS